ncbi:two-component system sensor histidine kinase NtrB [Desulfogranum marinum]|uniref:two-component system sensor histidine kinase NtrB n=1 Tax=Desulfogranum marinum TaxID=453220 RepID=UPI001966256F|nr:ATP-binding protein [Desulfogranum marinum]MBM9511064.1 GHKL domain-containing protein [Desulfogranum marinum]
MQNQWQGNLLRHAKQLYAAAAVYVAKIPRPDIHRLGNFFKHGKKGDGLLPFELVKYFSFTALLAMLITSFVLSWMISNNARSVLLKRSEAYSQLFADNLNRQVFLQFVLPTVVRYGRIALSEEKQYNRLDQIVRNITRGLRIDSVTIFDAGENRISYSTKPELMGKLNMGGLEYQKALEGENTTIVITGGSLFSLLPGMPEVFCTLKTFVPFHQEDRLGKRTGEIMGVVEIRQDLSDDLKAIIKLQARIIVFSLSIMGVLFAILSLIVVKANRTMTRRAAERIQLEEQLNKAQRLASLGKMVASVSHEIKNPLGIVRSTAEILLKRIASVAPGNEHLAGIIVEETTRLDNIVREFLDFARPREGAVKQEFINNVGERVMRFMESEFAKKQIAVEVDFSPDLPLVSMDSEQIYQVVFNIVFNAIQAMEQGGTLTMKTGFDIDQEQVWLTVDDTGPGIELDKQEQIFTPFYTEKNRGTGLGLSIAKSIVEKHNGQITVQSQMGVGSSFTIILPVQPAEPN